MRISKWTLLWLSIVLILVIVWMSMLAGIFNPASIVLNFFLIIFSLVVIAILAIIGAAFVGIFVSHRILSAQGFTPFEREMLEMREDVKDIKERMDRMEGLSGGSRKVQASFSGHVNLRLQPMHFPGLL